MINPQYHQDYDDDFDDIRSEYSSGDLSEDNGEVLEINEHLQMYREDITIPKNRRKGKTADELVEELGRKLAKRQGHMSPHEKLRLVDKKRIFNIEPIRVISQARWTMYYNTRRTPKNFIVHGWPHGDYSYTRDFVCLAAMVIYESAGILPAHIKKLYREFPEATIDWEARTSDFYKWLGRPFQHHEIGKIWSINGVKLHSYLREAHAKTKTEGQQLARRIKLHSWNLKHPVLEKIPLTAADKNNYVDVHEVTKDWSFKPPKKKTSGPEFSSDVAGDGPRLLNLNELKLYQPMYEMTDGGYFRVVFPGSRINFGMIRVLGGDTWSYPPQWSDWGWYLVHLDLKVCVARRLARQFGVEYSSDDSGDGPVCSRETRVCPIHTHKRNHTAAAERVRQKSSQKHNPDGKKRIVFCEDGWLCTKKEHTHDHMYEHEVGVVYYQGWSGDDARLMMESVHRDYFNDMLKEQIPYIQKCMKLKPMNPCLCHAEFKCPTVLRLLVGKALCVPCGDDELPEPPPYRDKNNPYSELVEEDEDVENVSSKVYSDFTYEDHQEILRQGYYPPFLQSHNYEGKIFEKRCFDHQKKIYEEFHGRKNTPPYLLNCIRKWESTTFTPVDVKETRSVKKEEFGEYDAFILTPAEKCEQVEREIKNGGKTNKHKPKTNLPVKPSVMGVGKRSDAFLAEHSNKFQDIDIEGYGLYSFETLYTRGDGNCFFHSVAPILNKEHHDLRREVYEYVIRNREKYAPQCIGRDIERIRIDGEHAGEIEIDALSNLYQCDIFVHSYPMAFTKRFNRLIIIHYTPGHFSGVYITSDKNNMMPIRLDAKKKNSSPKKSETTTEEPPPPYNEDMSFEDLFEPPPPYPDNNEIQIETKILPPLDECLEKVDEKRVIEPVLIVKVDEITTAEPTIKKVNQTYFFEDEDCGDDFCSIENLFATPLSKGYLFRVWGIGDNGEDPLDDTTSSCSSDDDPPDWSSVHSTQSVDSSSDSGERGDDYDYFVISDHKDYVALPLMNGDTVEKLVFHLIIDDAITLIDGTRCGVWRSGVYHAEVYPHVINSTHITYDIKDRLHYNLYRDGNLPLALMSDLHTFDFTNSIDQHTNTRWWISRTHINHANSIATAVVLTSTEQYRRRISMAIAYYNVNACLADFVGQIPDKLKRDLSYGYANFCTSETMRTSSNCPVDSLMFMNGQPSCGGHEKWRATNSSTLDMRYSLDYVTDIFSDEEKHMRILPSRGPRLVFPFLETYYMKRWDVKQRRFRGRHVGALPFTCNRNVDDVMKGYRSVGMRLLPVNPTMDPTILAVTTFNYLIASSRMLGQLKPPEEFTRCRIHQATFLAYLYDRYSTRPGYEGFVREIMRTLRARIVDGDDGSRYVEFGSENHSHRWVILQDAPYEHIYEHLQRHMTLFTPMVVLHKIGDWSEEMGATVRGAIVYMSDYVDQVGELFVNGQYNMTKSTLRKQQAATNIDIAQGLKSSRIPPSEAKFKIEMAKPGKAGRWYVSLGVKAIVNNDLAAIIKKVQHGLECVLRKEVDGKFYAFYVFPVVAPDSYTIAELIALYDWIVTQHNTFVCIVYSDDTLMLYNVNGQVHTFLCDISKCDASVGAASFLYLGLKHSGVRQKAREQFLRPLRDLAEPVLAVNPENPDEKVMIFHDTAMLKSGSILTTCVNTEDNTNIFIMFATLVEDFEYDAICRAYTLGANYVGHTVEIERCFTPQSNQFLKHTFFTATSGSTVFCINSGAILRSIGTVEGNLEPIHLGLSIEEFQKLSLKERWTRYISGVVNSYKNEPSDPILGTLRELFPFKKEESAGVEKYLLNNTYQRFEMKDYSHHVIAPEEWLARYSHAGADASMLSDFITTLTRHNVGWQIRHPLIDVILRVDYGYMPLRQ